MMKTMLMVEMIRIYDELFVPKEEGAVMVTVTVTVTTMTMTMAIMMMMMMMMTTDWW